MRQKKKKITRNLEHTRAQILDAAFLEIYTRSFQGVSVDDVVKRTHVTKGAFYHHFPTKLDLGYALVEDVIRPMILERWIEPLSAYKDPLKGILKQLQKNIGERTLEELRLGCPLNNLVQEMAPIDAGFRKRLQDSLELWVTEIERHLLRGQNAQLIRKDVNVREVAEFIVMMHEGIYGILKGFGEKTSFETMHRQLKLYFSTLVN